MFTGIVEATGKVVSFTEGKAAWLLKLEVPQFVAESLADGDSLACNGCCLTLISKEGNVVGFELLEETIRLTSFEGLTKGSFVNLERPLAANARLGGHFVSGHVDTRSSVLDFEQRGKNYYLRVAVPREFSNYVVYKGSIAIDGISLTIAEAHSDSLAVWLIPHTLEVTNLKDCKAGKFVNLEFDILAKYVEKIATGNREKSPYQPQA
jgi:riboflavin synthase, alpha subunit